MDNSEVKTVDFIRTQINEDLKNNKNDSRVHTRFPPEPNGFLHIGHAKAISVNHGIATEYAGKFNLRFDDTNPVKEDTLYVDAIKKDIEWLGANWDGDVKFASDYYQTFYESAVKLIKAGKAYVESLSAEEAREFRGSPTKPGKNSPYRDRSVDENLELFEKMKMGEFEEGECTLRAKIDMTHVNVHMRDPYLYRIRKVAHHRTGDDWCIYPMYDFAHCIEDAIEGITHSLCSLEFINHRELYDWILDNLDFKYRPRQIEFARLNLSYTVMSKRYLLELVETGVVNGWDDPRLPTISGMRRRGYSPQSIRSFCTQIGLSKVNSLVDFAFLEYVIREDLNSSADRIMAVTKPLKVTITNYPEGQTEEFEADNNPNSETAGKRMVPFSKELYIDRTDFIEEPPKKFFRMTKGQEVRLKHAYYVTCTDVIKDDNGEVTELLCTYDPESKGAKTPDGRKVKGTIQWVSIKHAVEAEVRMYDKLFTLENMGSMEEGKGYNDYLNPNSLEIINNAFIEPSIKERAIGEVVQFMRIGYFCKDQDSTDDKYVFNLTVALKDSWAKMQKKNK
ncbi:glutamine--tRNA ligase/YqeY domain fusion protein [Thiospirochaeta perfilievii]|uniref:Glutamine--tRNA ligase n=1 Tax=Thiospirochaeta perfilievii TaxID=252967 RepID=A0A5C1QAT5_9SPIO|nr:glutamine--tRNA ligase/YqeY domain fusion protein [Thiospirochaeta perfilievii]QEN05233.1 glutamine--tRNA ligase/YqeY domain fusion protein [Thiospirochaeta perfilievii]